MKLREKLWLLLSQTVNAVFFGGDPDESLSARAWRQRSEPLWERRLDRIDAWLGHGHCAAVWVAQRQREKGRV